MNRRGFMSFCATSRETKYNRKREGERRKVVFFGAKITFEFANRESSLIVWSCCAFWDLQKINCSCYVSAHNITFRFSIVNPVRARCYAALQNSMGAQKMFCEYPSAGSSGDLQLFLRSHRAQTQFFSFASPLLQWKIQFHACKR